MDIPDHWPDAVAVDPSSAANQKRQLQITLVDCPGHASLIRTIIGGAQIIDMIILVVDAVKGWQTQTTECLVLAELTSPQLMVVLNKSDMLDRNQRDKLLQIAKRKVQDRLHSTRFANAPIVGVAACVGGERVAAVGDDSNAGAPNETFQMDLLVKLLKQSLLEPTRTVTGPFYFAVDHCFPIRGRGTVLTGTVLSGSAAVNETIEFPVLSLERKVKSIQMFKRQVQTIRQGDRAGICVSNLDAKLLERGIAASPGAVPLWKGAIAVTRKVKYYPSVLQPSSKFHISVGHSTVMATVTFWGARELAHQLEKYQEQQQRLYQAKENQEIAQNQTQDVVKYSSLGGDAGLAGLPKLPFDFSQDFLQQDVVLESLTIPSSTDLKPANSEAPLHWALIDFQTPVHCPFHSLIIGSRLDTAVDNSGSSSCRLAFAGRLMERVDPATASSQLRLFTYKERRGIVSKLGDAHRRTDDEKVVRYEIFGSDLFKAETNMKLFIGMKLMTERGEIGEIKSSYATSGGFRVFFPGGTEAKEGEGLILRFKRYANDPHKSMVQDINLPDSRPGTRIEIDKPKKGKKLEKGVSRFGEVVSVKGDILDNGKSSMAIVSGLFSQEVNIKEKAGWKVLIPSTKEEGNIAGPFGKAGKCKVLFPNGVSATVGAKAELKL